MTLGLKGSRPKQLELVSISMVFVNKTLLGGGSVGGKTDAPLFVTWLQCVVTAAACLVAATH